MKTTIKKFFSLLVLTATVCFSLLNAQQQINNGGFENWEEIRSGVSEPMYWNSLKNTDGGTLTNRMAPEVCYKVTTAHSGKYALKLVNKSTMGIIANGMITTGAIHGNTDKNKSYVYTNSKDKAFSIPFTSRPDSITGWYQYTPKANDSAMVVVLLHNAYVQLPDKGTKQNWVGGVKLMLAATKPNTWKRFSIPIQYFKNSAPQYLLMVLSAGNRKQAVEGSIALFDDLQFVYKKKR